MVALKRSSAGPMLRRPFSLTIFTPSCVFVSMSNLASPLWQAACRVPHDGHSPIRFFRARKQLSEPTPKKQDGQCGAQSNGEGSDPDRKYWRGSIFSY